MINYPLSIQSFEDLRNKKCLYVDKTDYVYNLAYHGKTYFLARPRRFGKSLLCNTLRAFFEGKKHLFEGLKIYDLEKDWIKYPMIYLDFVSGDYTIGSITLIDKIKIALQKYEDGNGIQFDESIIKKRIETLDENIKKAPVKVESYSLSFRLEYDLEAVFNKTGLKTVMIVDEYDNPLIKSVNLETDKDIYRGFFSVLKSADRFLRFTFLTGVTKFAKTSIFSGFNQPVDITMDPNYSAVCGITHEELLSYFKDEIQAFAEQEEVSFDEMLSELKKWYDCYLFHERGKRVLNPVSLFNALQKKDFQNYWYDTGTPTILMQRIKNSTFDIKTLKNDVEYPKDELKDYKDDEFKTDLVPLLYYSGYLTIKSYEKEGRSYILGFPDYEVEMSFFNSLGKEFYTSDENPSGLDYTKFKEDFRTGDVEGAIERMKALFCSLPYAQNKSLRLIERDFQNVIYLVFTILGEYIISEAHFSKGRADSILINKKYVYIFEFKIDQDAQTALNQINVKNYAGRFKMDDRQIIKVGVSFSSTEKNITDWVMEEV
ncbi:MAG: AAA family ATPase [Bacteroidales bacterium]|nr:AAA family ATPase [Bacteroidales bacterium]